MVKKIVFRALIEVLGKPKEHVEHSLQGYIKKLKQDEKYTVIDEDYVDAEKKEESELWATFTELEVKTETVEDLITFCFEYMPSSIEILEPSEIVLSDQDISHFLSNLQGRLHQVDMIAKQMKLENDALRANASKLVKNNLLILLAKGPMTAEQLSKYTGVTQEKLEDFLDKLIDEKRINLKEGLYTLTFADGN
ncbi:hypothetical protein COY27_06255 [Candidatus Woesearchaeota archaeon CG_4_10_14_0_2_um_filter_33_13]|nr:MAG: hypothetical protein COY27_06255 [Candidatus Woesearchaeota archaeon CG_4_10_14_0_2_um_filter_33_13]